MARKFKKVPQPPIDADRRDSESRSVLIGLLIAGAGIALVLSAVRPRAGAEPPARALSDFEMVELFRVGAPLGQAEPGHRAEPAGAPRAAPTKDPKACST